ncbi:hypothetical protein AAZX31_07G203800 [Glycine max]
MYFISSKSFDFIYSIEYLCDRQQQRRHQILIFFSQPYLIVVEYCSSFAFHVSFVLVEDILL